MSKTYQARPAASSGDPEGTSTNRRTSAWNTWKTCITQKVISDKREFTTASTPEQQQKCFYNKKLDYLFLTG